MDVRVMPQVVSCVVLNHSTRSSFMATGTVKWFSQAKGYGFIQPDDGGSDLFIHFSNISGAGFRNLEEGQKVEYEPQEGRKGMEATNVNVLG
jgi:CspA family cold shock protein